MDYQPRRRRWTPRTRQNHYRHPELHKRQCFQCGYWCWNLREHKRFNCRARQSRCYKCAHFGHYSRVCFQFWQHRGQYHIAKSRRTFPERVVNVCSPRMCNQAVQIMNSLPRGIDVGTQTQYATANAESQCSKVDSSCNQTSQTDTQIVQEKGVMCDRKPKSSNRSSQTVIRPICDSGIQTNPEPSHHQSKSTQCKIQCRCEIVENDQARSIRVLQAHLADAERSISDLKRCQKEPINICLNYPTFQPNGRTLCNRQDEVYIELCSESYETTSAIQPNRMKAEQINWKPTFKMPIKNYGVADVQEKLEEHFADVTNSGDDLRSDDFLLTIRLSPTEHYMLPPNTLICNLPYTRRNHFADNRRKKPVVTDKIYLYYDVKMYN